MLGIHLTHRSVGTRACLAAVVAAVLCTPAAVEAEGETMVLAQARQLAREHRAEIRAALARLQAAKQRPAIVSALDDPMLSPAIDHYPDRMMPEAAVGDGMESEAPAAGDDRRYDWSVTVEQRFPMSRLLSHRRRAAEADVERQRAEAERVALDVEKNAVESYVMLYERQQMVLLVQEQQVLARQLVASAVARYASANGTQAEVLRAEVEVARADAAIQTAAAELRAAVAMFNASLARPLQSPSPALRDPVDDAEPPVAASLRDAALRQRPELRAGGAEMARAEAETAAMRAMYLPMGMLRIGRASTMAEGPGTMAMLGISLPIWTGRLRAGVAESQAMEAMAEADVDAMRRMVEAEAVSAGAVVSGARQQYLALRDDIVPRARMALTPAEAAYASGQGSLTALIETLQTLWMVQTDLVMSRSQLALAWARLQRATGEAAVTGEQP